MVSVCIRIVYVLLSSQLNFSNEPNQILSFDWSAVNQNTRLPLVGTQPFSRIYCPKALRVGLAEERKENTPSLNLQKGYEFEKDNFMFS